MKRHAKLWGAAALVAAIAAPLSVHAQERGRTDGPEGSEYGKGGYERVGAGRFSLSLDWGAAVMAEKPLGGAPDGPPLMIGGTLSFWGDDWFQLDVSGAYLVNGERVDMLAGPRFRTYDYPLSFSLGLKAGLLYIPEVGVRFGLAPQVGADVIMANRHVVAGLAYSPDIPLGGGSVAHKMFMNIGYRF